MATPPMTKRSVLIALANTKLRPATPDELNTRAGINQRVRDVAARISAVSNSITSWERFATADDEAARLAELRAERSQLIAHRDALLARHAQIDADLNLTWTRCFQRVVKSHTAPDTYRAWIAETDEMAEAAQRRAESQMVGAALPMTGASGSPRKRA